MKKFTTAKKFAALILAAALAICALAGCSATGSSANLNTNNQTPEQQNREYMSKVTLKMTDLATNLVTFTDAVTRSDAISMKTQCDKAMASLDEVKNIEAPEAMKDVKAKYDSGCDSLKQALTQYVDLYTSGADITQEALDPIQQLYDQGVQALKEADEAVANLR